MKHVFVTQIIQEEGKNATGIRVPAEIIAAMNSGKKPRVKVSIGNYIYQTTVAAYGNVFMIPLSQAHRNSANVQAGDEVEVTLELDTEPRTVDLPDYLVEVLKENGVKETFDALAYSKRKEFVRQVVSAKAEETRLRRIDKIVAGLKDM